MRHRFFCLTIFVAMLTASRVAQGQSQSSTWPITSDFPRTLGQAQSGRVMIGENDFGSVWRYTETGTLLNYAQVGNNARSVENSDGDLFVAQAGPPLLFRVGGPSLNLGPDCYAAAMVPLDGGRIMVRHTCGTATDELRIYDRDLVLQSAFPDAHQDNDVRGMTRRPDGSIVLSTGSGASGRLTAYDLPGTVLWSRAIASTGPAAADGEGNLYVLVSPTLMHVYDSQGQFHHTWGGPAGQPLAFVVDIASSLDGARIFALSSTINGPVRVFGQFPTAVVRNSWGQIKALYRSDRSARDR